MDELTDDDSSTFVSCNVKVEGDVVTIVVSGELDLSNVVAVREVVDDARGEGRPSLIFDLSELHFMDSSGLGLLIEVAQGAEKIEVWRPSPAVRRLIEISGLEAILPMRD
jgi:anti-sigma B factor antagonist